jgi:hypothetical protein
VGGPLRKIGYIDLMNMQDPNFHESKPTPRMMKET